jgi:hypothetical protein
MAYLTSRAAVPVRADTVQVLLVVDRNSSGEIPIVVNASISWVTFMLPNCAA